MHEATLDKEFARTAYDAHHSLFRHYSEQIFKTRISIITLILIFAGYLLGVVPLQNRPVAPIVSALLAFLAALLVVLLFSNEIAYYRRLTQVVQTGRFLESYQGAPLYFSKLDHMSHWRLYSIYAVAIAFFLAAALTKFYQSAVWNKYRLLALLILVPVGLTYWALVEFSRTAKTGLGPTRTEQPAPNTTRADEGIAMSDARPEPIATRTEQADRSGGQEVVNAILAQYHAAEYSLIMGRVSSWESLQYAAWPILLAALALLAQMEDIDGNFRWWAALISTLLVYVAYQGTMVNMLYYVLVIERDLRPLAGQLVGNENFWIHERIRKKDFPPNPAWSTKWPVLISSVVIAFIAVGLVYEYGAHWYDGACLVLSFVLLYFVTQLTKNGERLKIQIKEACTPDVKFANHAAVVPTAGA